jgi:hypothetical protein
MDSRRNRQLNIGFETIGVWGKEAGILHILKVFPLVEV